MKRQRIAEIEELINKRGQIKLKDLSEHFPHVSQMTLRRDLLVLEQEGKILPRRGGAVSVQEAQKISNIPYSKKSATHTDEKIEIAQKTATLIEEGVSLYLDAGTTAMYLAKEMPDKRYNVFTNGLAVASELAKKTYVNVNLLGGVLIKENLSTASSLASVFFTDSNFEIAVLSAAAFTPESGFSVSSQMEADLCKLICRKAKQVYMMLDSSKIGKIKPYTFARLEDINVLITDSAFPEDLRKQLIEKNVVIM